MFFKIAALSLGLLIFNASASAMTNTETLAARAVSNDPAISAPAINSLRKRGQAGLDALFDEHATEIAKYLKTGKKTESWLRVAKAIDSVAMQKDAFSSRLFWHTDLEKAKALSASTKKPILSLRLLGGLNEEYSCANSRFFRSIFYSNPDISKLLRENFVLHWKSVRPAPKITIDFGDGRKLVRTITGNSIHYIADANGKIVDALPGLYSPNIFLAKLRALNSVYKNPTTGDRAWKRFHERNRAMLLMSWKSSLDRIKVSESTVKTDNWKPVEGNPSALRAARLAVTKSAVELPSVESISYSVESLKESTDFEEWKEIAKSFGKPLIHGNSRRFIRLKTGDSASISEFKSLIENLEKYVAIDTAQNEFLFHTKIFEWLTAGNGTNIDKFNERVYRELFKTPRSDEWLGLYSSDIYSAIENNGIVN